MKILIKLSKAKESFFFWATPHHIQKKVLPCLPCLYPGHTRAFTDLQVWTMENLK